MAVRAANSKALKQATGAGLTVGKQVIAFTEALLLSVWIGSMVFFSFAVAPSAFAVLPTRELAGSLVTSAIGKLELIGLIIGPLLVIIQATSRHAGRAASIFRYALVTLMIVSAAGSRFLVSPKMVSLRQAMGGHIDDVPVTDPLRIQFNSLHQYSVSLMALAMLAGFCVLFLTVRSWLKR